MLTFLSLLLSIGVGFLVYVSQVGRVSAFRRKLRQAQRSSLLIFQEALARDLDHLDDVLCINDGVSSFVPLQMEWRVLNKQAQHLEWLRCEDHLKREELYLLQTSISDLWQRVMMEQQLCSQKSGPRTLFL